MKIILSALPAVVLAVSFGAQAAQGPSNSQSPATANPAPGTASHADAYYYFSLGHIQEEQFEEEFQATGKSDMATQAIDSYKKALDLEPNSPVIMERLAEIYAESQRIRDAVAEAQEVLKIDADNLAAHRLLSRIYVRTLGNLSSSEAQAAGIARATTELEAVMKLAPTDSDSALWLTRLYRLQNKPDAAEKILRGVLQREQDNGEALEQLSQLMMDEGRSKEAIDLLTDAAADLSSPDIEDLLGDAYAQEKQFDKAEEAYKKAVDMDPDEPSHRHGLADTLVAEQKYPDAIAQFQKLTQLEPGTAENYLRISQLYRQTGQYDQAETALMRAKQLTPGNLEVLDNEALLYEEEGRYDDAAKVLTDAIAGAKNPTSGQASPSTLAMLYEQLGDAYRKQHNYSAAVDTYATMGKLSVDTQKRAQMLTIDTYRESRDLDRAITEAKKISAQSPNDPSITGVLAMLYGDKGDSATATKLLQGLLKGNAGDQQIYLNIAEVQQHGKKYSDAEQSAQKAESMAQEPEEKESAWYMLGAIYEQQKKYDLAEEEFKKALGATPNNPSVLNYYGYMLADRGVRLDEATSMIQKAVDQEPANGAYLDSLGWAYYKQNKLTEAQEYLRKAILHDPDDPTILSHLGNVYLKLGQNEQAASLFEKSWAQWQKVLPADYEADKANEVDTQLKAVRRRLAQKTSPNTSNPQ
jgi:tetratricopeptide (TPR) repeat protein